MTDDIKDCFVGSLLGAMTGDALGRPAKGRTPEELLERDEYGEEMIGGFYTEDTEMLVNVAESLVGRGALDPDDVAQRLGRDLTPMRGYNPGALEVLYLLQQGTDWRDANRAVFEEGSFGMGAACRAAPVGLFYHDDLDALTDAAVQSARVTHAHPQGEAGALAVALGVALCVQGAAPRDMYDHLLVRLESAGYGEFVPYLTPLNELLAAWPTPVEVVERLGNGLTAQAVVPAAFYAFWRHADDFRKALVFAVNLGGEADTIAAITGALAGAYHGTRRMPAEWVDRLENGDKGRDYMRELAGRLFSTWRNRPRAG